MTSPRPRGHRDVIETALYDWWLTTDPAEPFHAPAVARHVETCLTSHGYTITPTIPVTPRTPPVPTRRSITAALAITALCALSVALAAHRGDWPWALAGAAAGAFLTREAIRDIRDRRNHRNAR